MGECDYECEDELIKEDRSDNDSRTFSVKSKVKHDQVELSNP